MAPGNRLILLLGLCACAYAQYAEERAPRYIASASEKVAPTPVPILKQINKHNEDGSYTYGYEAADGSFKIETKEANGEVKGKYGYKDDTGKVRVVEYGANKFGFQPSGEGITVAPPTLVDESKNEEQERERPAKGRTQYRAPVDYDYSDPAPAPAPRPRPSSRQQLRSQGPAPPKPQFFAGAAPVPDQGNLFRPAPTPRKTDFRAGDSFQSFTNPTAQPQIEYTQNYAPEPQQFTPAQQPRYQQYQDQQQFSQGNQFAQAPQQFSQAPQQFSQPPQQFSQAPQQFSQGSQQYPQENAHFSQLNSQFSQGNRPFSMLDQLLKEYALPQGGAAPLHDITFGSY